MKGFNLNEAAIAVSLIVAIAAVVVVTIVSGSAALTATGLSAVVVALAGGLLGSKVPKP